MGLLSSFDKEEKTFGGILMVFNLLLLAFLLLKPVSFNIMVIVAGISTLGILLLALYLCYKALQLYGNKSAEGKIWMKLVIMLSMIGLGFAISESRAEPAWFAGFTLVGFLVISWGIIEKIRHTGMHPGIKELGTSAVAIFAILTFISVIMRFTKDYTVVDNVDLGDYTLQFITIAVAFITTFLAILLAQLMGGHISKGWYFFSAGATVFSINYSLLTALRAMGHDEKVYFLESFSILALNLVAFSAYYQRKRHLALIADMM